MQFLGKEIPSPLVLASGILGISFASLHRVIREGAGMVTTKSLSLEPRTGHDSPILAEFEGGMVNSVGLTNPGIQEGLKEVVKYKDVCEAPIIVSVFGGSHQDFVELAGRVNDSPADFLELNLSCPNVEDEFKRPFALDNDKVAELTSAVKTVSRIPVLPKLSPNALDLAGTARIAEENGADGLTLINTLGHGMVIDARARRPVLRNNFGGISGPCIKPLALKLIYDVFQVVNIPIIGTGGVTTGIDAIEMLLAGASAVSLGTAVYYRGPEAFTHIRDEMQAFMEYENIPSFESLIGSLELNA